MSEKRETFSSPLAIFFATLGSAVGLGNIWKFPYMVGANGGGAFLIVYIICILLVGLPIMISEFFIGKSTRKSPILAFKQLSEKYTFVGYLYLASTYLVLFFYSCVAGWVFLYVFKSITFQFKNLTVATSSDIFSNVTIGPFTPVIWQLIAILVVGFIISSGVKSGIEKMTKNLMPVLAVLLVVVAIRGLTLDGALEGLKFLFYPDFSKLTSQGVLAALGLAFFKLSVAMGALITYASYFTKDVNMIKTGVSVAISDTVISLLAGIAIFPAVFTFGLNPSEGAGLLFITIPLVFSKMPFGQILLIAFFILVAIAATGAMLSLMEVTVASLMDIKKFSRRKSVIISGSIIFIFGLLATLSYNPDGLLGHIKDPITGSNIFNMYDKISSNILMPLGGLSTAIISGYLINKDIMYSEISNEGKLKIHNVYSIYRVVLRYITPILVAIVLITSLGIF